MIYEAECLSCKKTEDYIRSVAERHNTPVCCGKPMKKKITTCQTVYGDLNFVTSDINGDEMHITSRQQHDRLCKENNVSPMGIKGEF